MLAENELLTINEFRSKNLQIIKIITYLADKMLQ